MARIARGERYSNVAIAFHWSIALLVIANLVIGIGHDAIPFLRTLMGAHKAIGITVLVLTAGRVAWRIAHRPPALPARTQPWEKGVARATHWTLYILMIVMPLTGWMLVSGPGPKRAMTWFGLFDIPTLPIGKGLADLGHNAHGLLGWVMAGLVVLHIAAALRHHLLLRDTVLQRMAPALARR
jgi:cytochrome b561